MRLSCPSCGTTFAIPGDKAKAGQKARCARCKTVFRIPALPASAPQERAQSAKESSGQGSGSWGEPDLAGLEDDSKAAAEERAGEAPWGGGAPEGALDLAPDQGFPEAPSNAKEQAPLELGQANANSASEEEDREDPTLELSLPKPSPPPGGQQKAAALGQSAIRAQSGAHHRGGAEREEAPIRRGWFARLSSGKIEHFEALDEAYAWIEANPEQRVELSSDGQRWQDPGSLKAAQAAIPVPEPAIISVALRSASITDARSSSPGRAGIWALWAPLSTLIFLLSLLLLLQTYGVVSLQAVLPLNLEAIGLGAIATDARNNREETHTINRGGQPQEEAEVIDPELRARQGYETKLAEAKSSRADRRWMDAVVSYRQAIEFVESPEALEELASLYEDLGEVNRAKKTRERLVTLRAEREGRTPSLNKAEGP